MRDGVGARARADVATLRGRQIARPASVPYRNLDCFHSYTSDFEISLRRFAAFFSVSFNAAAKATSEARAGATDTDTARARAPAAAAAAGGQRDTGASCQESASVQPVRRKARSGASILKNNVQIRSVP